RLPALAWQRQTETWAAHRRNNLDGHYLILSNITTRGPPRSSIQAEENILFKVAYFNTGSSPASHQLIISYHLTATKNCGANFRNAFRPWLSPSISRRLRIRVAGLTPWQAASRASAPGEAAPDC